MQTVAYAWNFGYSALYEAIREKRAFSPVPWETDLTPNRLNHIRQMADTLETRADKAKARRFTGASITGFGSL